jgi:tetratricopeptide (TPR) repeat protein
MRKEFLLLPLLLVFMLSGAACLPASADTGDFQEGFNRASQLYEKGRYAEALSLYLDIEKTTPHWKLFYNMGNCYYKLGDFVRAKVYYLRARRLRPFEPSILENIDIVDKRFNDRIAGEKPDFLTRAVLRIEAIISVNVVSAALLVLAIILNLFIFLLMKKGKSRFRLYGVSFSLVLTLLIAGYHTYRTGKQNVRDTAVIVKENSQLRSGPGENNTVLFKVNPGLKVKIIEKSRDWVQVSASSQVAGWLEEDRLERI